MHTEILAEDTRRVLDKIRATGVLSDFYMVGGTALALHYGHRKSIDLDFFSPKDFSLLHLKKSISQLGNYTLENEEPGTLDGILDQVKLTFLRYEYPLLFPLISYENILLADARDIGCMKLDAISSRGSRKDFIDLFVLLDNHTLAELFELFKKKYSGIQYNKLHIIKSLSYFEDAEEEPMPIMLRNISWEAVKEKITKEARALVV